MRLAQVRAGPYRRKASCTRSWAIIVALREGWRASKIAEHGHSGLWKLESIINPQRCSALKGSSLGIIVAQAQRDVLKDNARLTICSESIGRTLSSTDEF